MTSTKNLRTVSAKPATVPEREDVHKVILPGGLTLVTARIPGAHAASIGVWIHAGSRYESPALNGISHFVEHAVFKGTSRRKTHQIAQCLESVGGYLNAFTTKEHTCYYARVMSAHLPRAVDLLSDLVLRPVFPGDEIEKEKQVIIEELRGAEDEPEDLVHDNFEKLLFAPHPLGQTIIGTEESVSALRRTDLLGFCSRYHVPANMLVAVAGSAAHDEVRALVGHAFATARGKVVSRIHRRPAPNRPGVETSVKPIHQVHICTGRGIPGIRTPLRHAMVLLNTLIGDGMSSRLFQLLRERHGLAYTVYSSLGFMREAGVFSIYVGTDQAEAGRCRDLIRRELDRLRIEGIPPRVLLRIKEQVKGNLLLGLEGTTDRMMHIARNELYLGRHVTIGESLRRIDAVTMDAVVEAASIICDTDSFSTSILHPAPQTA